MGTDRLKSLMKMYNEDPRDSFIRFAIAKEYEKIGDDKMALEHYLSLKEDDPDYVGLYYHLAKLMEEMEKESQALSVYEEGIAIAKKLKDFHALSELNSAKTNLELEL